MDGEIEALRKRVESQRTEIANLRKAYFELQKENNRLKEALYGKKSCGRSPNGS